MNKHVILKAEILGFTPNQFKNKETGEIGKAYVEIEIPGFEFSQEIGGKQFTKIIPEVLRIYDINVMDILKVGKMIECTANARTNKQGKITWTCNPETGDKYKVI